MMTTATVKLVIDHDSHTTHEMLQDGIESHILGLIILRGTPHLQDKRDPTNDRIEYDGSAIIDDIEVMNIG